MENSAATLDTKPGHLPTMGGAQKEDVHAQDQRDTSPAFDLKLGQRQIARSVNLGQSTVHDCLARFAASNLAWPLPPELTETALEDLLYATAPRAPQPRGGRELPDFERVHDELRTNKNTTLQLL